MAGNGKNIVKNSVMDYPFVILAEDINLLFTASFNRAFCRTIKLRSEAIIFLFDCRALLFAEAARPAVKFS